MISPDAKSFRSGPLSLRVESDQGARTLRLSGELDLATADVFRAAVDDALASDEELVIDLSALTFIDSTGIAILIAAITDGAEQTRFVPSQAPAVTRVLRLTGVEERMRLID